VFLVNSAIGGAKLQWQALIMFGLVRCQAVQLGIEESLKVSSSKQSVPLSRVVDFGMAREVFRELKMK
jgi:hypothetical protein